MKRTIIIDDDPTGIQTIHDCLVLTAWDVATLEGALQDRVTYFYILSNTRSMAAIEAEAVIAEISRNIVMAVHGRITGINIICRSDSTLRGHFPLELETVEKTLGMVPDVRFFIPAFIEGNRVTVDGHHYIREISLSSSGSGEKLIPCDETEFSRDSVFGYSTSYLPNYIGARIENGSAVVASIHLKDLRGHNRSVIERIAGLPKGSYCVVDAERYGDLESVCEMISELQQRGRHFSFQTAASFVRSFTQTSEKPPIERFDVKSPGLILVGSHVGKTTRQVNHLLSTCDVFSLEIDVTRILEDFGRYLLLVVGEIEKNLKKNRSVIVYTSRKECVFDTVADRLCAGKNISTFLIRIIRQLAVEPGFLISKGGITSHDTLSQGLGLKQIRVLGQAEPGVPVLMVPESHPFGAIPFVIFPGNVGSYDSLTRVFLKMRV